MDPRHNAKVKSFRVLLKYAQRYPGDKLRGVVEITLDNPLVYSALKAKVFGEELARFGNALSKKFDTEARHSVYYTQAVVLAGQPSKNSNASSDKPELEHSSTAAWSDASSLPDTSTTTPPFNIITLGLMPGTYYFPFLVTLPNVLPPSYDDHRGDGFAKMSYFVKVKLFLGNRTIAKDRAFFAIKMLPVNPKQWVSVHRGGGHTRNSVMEHEQEGSQGGNGSNGEKSSGEVIPLPRGSVLFVNHTLRMPSAESGNGNEDATNSYLLDEEDEEEGLLVVQIDENRNRNSMDHNSNSNHVFTESEPPKARVNNWAIAEEENEGTGDAAGFSPTDSQEEAPNLSQKQREVKKEEPNANLPAHLVGLPSWEHHLDVHISGFFKKGSVSVCLTLPSLIFARGDPVIFRATVDNSNGLKSITKMTFTLINRIEVSSKTESHEFKSPMARKTVMERVSLDHTLGIPETQLMIPKNAPLTMITAGIKCRSFLEVSVSSVQALKTHTGSARTELVIVDRFYTGENSTRTKIWTNYFRGLEIKAGTPLLPDVNCPFTTHGEMRIVKEDDEEEKENEDSDVHSEASAGSKNDKKERKKGSRALDFENVVYIPKSHPKVGKNGTSKNPLY